MLCVNNSYAQGNRCESIQPFCSGDAQFVFPNSNQFNSNVAQAEVGPDYSCLKEQPYPAWFFLKIDKPGELNFEISQTVNADGSGLTLDVDYIAWGPFEDGEDFCTDESLSLANVAGCSYLYAPLEIFNIANAKRGEIYVVLITNFSQKEGFISLDQVNSNDPNAGSTDCSIVSLLGEDLSLCGESSVELQVNNVYADSYKWLKKDITTGNYEEIPSQTNSSLLVTTSGDYRVVVLNNLTNSEVSDDISIQLSEPPVATVPQDLSNCSLSETAIFNLNNVNSELTTIYNTAGDSFTSNFYESQLDLTNNIPINNASNFEGTNDQIILATIINNRTGCVSNAVSFQLKLQDAIQIDLNEITSVCTTAAGDLIEAFSLGQDLGNGYSYNWTPDNDPDGDGLENPVFIVSSLTGNNEYSLEIEDLSSGCIANFRTTILTYSPPVSIDINISGNDFENGYNVEAIVKKGLGADPSLEYRLDSGNWQQSNTFNNVAAGNHSVAARVVGGCGSLRSQNFVLVGYPRFFTPNSDGYNDTWNVITDVNLVFKRLFIFDRYGKLLKQLDPKSGGWDGTFNGNALPADDYWFSVELENVSKATQQFKGHFTLKR